MKIDFVLTTLNDIKNLKRVIPSILEQENLKRLIVVDAGSEDGSIEFLRGQKKIDLIIKKCNRSKGRNLGIKRAKTKLIAIVNSDAILEKNWSEKMLEIMKTLPENAAGLACYHKFPKKQNFVAKTIWHIPDMVHTSEFHLPELRHNGLVETRSVPNEAAIYKRDVLLKVGLFDETLNWGEDSELNLRIIKKGYRLFTTKNVEIEHIYKSSLRSFFKQQKGYGKGARVLEVRKRDIVKEHLGKKLLMVKLSPLILAFMLMVFLFFPFTVILVPSSIYLILLFYEIMATRTINKYILIAPVLLIVKYMANIWGYWKEWI